jgi:hypothetical protein
MASGRCTGRGRSAQSMRRVNRRSVCAPAASWGCGRSWDVSWVFMRNRAGWVDAPTEWADGAPHASCRADDGRLAGVFV